MNSKAKIAHSLKAQEAMRLVIHLQDYFVQRLNAISKAFGTNQPFEEVSWLRDAGLHGGGTRFVAVDDSVFNRASVNVSQVQYDDDPSKKLASATAISTIIHPLNPLVPSMHMHISWTEMKDGTGYWRMMADLNPAIEDKNATEIFLKALKILAPHYFEEARAQGDKYFYIPALGRHRGAAHFYLENFSTGDTETDKKLAKDLGEGVIDSYIEIITAALKLTGMVDEASRQKQLAYHTLYLFQVLTLDRGTTSGLLIHDQNDLGIMGSLPRYIDKGLLVSWLEKVDPPQNELLQAIIDALPENRHCEINDAVKQQLANAVRSHYKKYPDALIMQASGNVVPETVGNHI